MKLRNIAFPFFDLTTGYLQAGAYKSDSIIKIAELCRTNKGIVPQLLPTYYKNDTITLKRKNNIVGYRVIYYGSLTLFDEENYKLINKHCHSIPKTEALKFLTKPKDMKYTEYCKKLRPGYHATDAQRCAYYVKIADMKDHLAQTETLTDRLKKKYLEGLAELL